eukprot:3831575-Prymnesium_polylepis.1
MTVRAATSPKTDGGDVPYPFARLRERTMKPLGEAHNPRGDNVAVAGRYGHESRGFAADGRGGVVPGPRPAAAPVPVRPGGPIRLVGPGK